MSAMKTLATAAASAEDMTWQERDMLTRATLAACADKAGQPFAHAYLVGILSTMLTDAQVREAFTIATGAQA